MFGKLPFNGVNEFDLFHKICTKELQLPNHKVSNEFKDLIYKLLEKIPSRRITVEEIRVIFVDSFMIGQRLT